jgi:hypothetical protein
MRGSLNHPLLSSFTSGGKQYGDWIRWHLEIAMILSVTELDASTFCYYFSWRCRGPGPEILSAPRTSENNGDAFLRVGLAMGEAPRWIYSRQVSASDGRLRSSQQYCGPGSSRPRNLTGRTIEFSPSYFTSPRDARIQRNADFISSQRMSTRRPRGPTLCSPTCSHKPRHFATREF